MPDGRLWVLEMLTFLPDTSGRDSTRAAQPRQRAGGHQRRRQDGQEDRVRRQAGDAARAEGARSRRARRRAAEPVADEGHRRRPQGRHQGAGRQHLRQPERRHRAQRQQPVLGDGQRDVLVRTRLGPALAERQVRVAAGAEPRPVAGVAGRRRAHLPQRERLAAVRRLHAVALLPAQSQRRPDARPLRAADRADGRDGVSGAEQPRRQPRLPRSVLPRGRLVDRHSGRRHADDLSRRRLSEGPAAATRSSPTRRPISCTGWW